MGANTAVTTGSAIATGAGAAETAILTTNAQNLNSPAAAGVAIRGHLNVTPGASTTAVVVKVRLGANTTTGTQIYTATHTLAAAASGSIPFEGVDTTVASLTNPALQYTVTLTQTGGAGAGTVNVIAAEVTALQTTL